MRDRTSQPSLVLGSSAVLFYGLLTRLTFGAQMADEFLGLITLAFVLFVPFALGALTVFILPQKYKTSWLASALTPWLSALVVAAAILILAWEAIICIIMALPLYLTLSSLGGLAMWVIITRRSKNTGQMSLAIFMLLPYFVALAENQIPTPDTIRTVNSQIVIDAPAEVVWAQIASVPEIQSAEHHPAIFWLIGLPKPIQAMLPQNGVGAVRRSMYEEGLFFTEVVTTWQPPEQYRFTIALDPTTNPPWPWSQIGGSYFELLDGQYRIRALKEGQVRLELSSRHRLSTKLNRYGGLWTDFILADLQNYILSIIKGRAEARF